MTCVKCIFELKYLEPVAQKTDQHNKVSISFHTMETSNSKHPYWSTVAIAMV